MDCGSGRVELRKAGLGIWSLDYKGIVGALLAAAMTKLYPIIGEAVEL
jgi:hypothetical protein